MKDSARLAEIRQLCCLGLDSAMIMPALLRLVSDWVPSHTLLFAWADDDGFPCRVYLDAPSTIPTSELYIAEFCNKRETRVVMGFTELMRRGPVVENFSRYGRALPDSELYDAVFRPIAIHHAMRVAVRDRARPRGAMFLHRERAAPEFSAADEARMRQIVPYVAHALDPSGPRATPFVDSGDHGVLVVDRAGRLTHADARGRHLLYLAARPRGAIQGEAGEQVLLRRLAGLAADLRAVFDGAGAPPPVWHHRNAWGQFVFRAYWLDAARPGGGLVGVVIQHWIPRAMKVLLAMRELPLSGRQRELCLLLAQDLTRGAIARRMAVSPHTVVDYTRAVYDKLGVSSRPELLERLLAGPGGTALLPVAARADGSPPTGG